MIYPVIGAYKLGDKVRIEIDGVLREGEIICIGFNGYVVASDACVYIVNDPQIKWCARTSGESVAEEKEVIRYNSDTAIGLATLNKAFELQKKYTELEGEVKRLYDVILARQIERFTVYTPFNNHNLSLIAGTLNNFRPLTAEERLQQEAELKEFIDKTLKKQSE